MQLVTAGPSREPDAESCLRRLIELDPNRVQAQNLLAYGAMNRGDFARAEEQFEIYRFLAPDQANPHDSLGELLMVTGRYDEAKQEFHKALALKPDFCPPWQNLVNIELLRRNAGAAREVVDEARDAGGCPPPVIDRLVCQVPLWPMANEGRWQEIWDSVWSCGGGEKAAEAEAGEEAGDGVSDELAGDDAKPVEPPPEDRVIFAVMAALHTGRLDDARRIAEQVAARAEPDAGDMYSMRSALVEHLAGLVAAGNGDMEVAVDHLRAADDRTVWGGGIGDLQAVQPVAARRHGGRGRRRGGGAADDGRAGRGQPPVRQPPAVAAALRGTGAACAGVGRRAPSAGGAAGAGRPGAARPGAGHRPRHRRSGRRGVSEARDPHRRLAWRIGIGVLAAAVAVGVAVVVVRGHEGERWTTDSEVARGELEAGRRALDKLYVNEAVDHFLAAVEADPDFLAPKVLLLRHGSYVAGGRERLDRLVDELRGADLGRVTPRERLLVRHTLALVDRRSDEARRLVDDYLAAEPDDPWAVELRCGHAWGDDEWAAAKDCYRRLIELDPNRVEAQNRIGYMEMAEGHFDEAAAQFQIYGFLAPDQANPHDSMGELMLLTGRYDEAEAELRQALALKPDFCASWLNLVLLHELRHDFDGAEAVVADAAGACPEASLAKMTCSIGLWRNADAGLLVRRLGRRQRLRRLAGRPRHGLLRRRRRRTARRDGPAARQAAPGGGGDGGRRRQGRRQGATVAGEHGRGPRLVRRRPRVGRRARPRRRRGAQLLERPVAVQAAEPAVDGGGPGGVRPRRRGRGAAPADPPGQPAAGRRSPVPLAGRPARGPMITAVVSKKGGVGKTTTAVSLAAALAARGRRVLLVDLDSQASASMSLGVPRSALAPSVADVLLWGRPVRQAIRRTGVPHLDLVTASVDLVSADFELGNLRQREVRLASVLERIRGDYDFIVLDCPPGMGLLPVNALAAADAFLVPVAPQFLAITGVDSLLAAAERIRHHHNPRLALAGILLTLVDYRSNETRRNVDELRRRYGAAGVRRRGAGQRPSRRGSRRRPDHLRVRPLRHRRPGLSPGRRRAPPAHRPPAPHPHHPHHRRRLTGHRELPACRASPPLETICRSRAPRRRVMLYTCEHNGVIADEPVYHDDGTLARGRPRTARQAGASDRADALVAGPRRPACVR